MAYLTKPQVDVLTREIDLLRDSLYRANSSPAVRASTLLEFEKRKILESNTERMLKDWKSEMSGLKVLKLTLAFEPDQTALQRIWQWASQNIAPNIVLDLDYKPEIVAGVIVAYGGKYYDGSYLPKFNSEFESNYGQLQEILKRNL